MLGLNVARVAGPDRRCPFLAGQSSGGQPAFNTMKTDIFTVESPKALAVRAPFIAKDVCKGLPGARWDGGLKAWKYPATPALAKVLSLTFPRATWSDTAARLLDTSRTIDAAAVQKQSEDLPAIPLTKTRPWKHQLQAFHFARYLPAAMLALDMGTGKTKVTIDLIVNRDNCRRVLILAPKSVVAVWPAEFEKHCPAPFQVLALDDGSLLERTKTLMAAMDLAMIRGSRIAVVLNYEAAWRLPIRSALLGTLWDLAILDESHRIKKPGGKQSMFCNTLSDRVPARLCLTGTPMPHSPLDVYAQYRFLDKGLFGTSFTVFRARYAIMGGFNGKQVVGYQNQEDLNRKFYTIAFRVKSDDVLDLPEAVDVVRLCQLEPYAKRIYASLEAEFVADVGVGQITAANAMTRLLRLQQVTSGYAKTDRSIESGEEGELLQVDHAKQELLADVLEDLSDTEPVIIFCRFHHDLDAVHTVAGALSRQSLELSGRKNELLRWQQGEAPILAVQIQSGGLGVNLVRSRYAVFFSLGFSLAEYLQARKRVHRPGQQHNVTYVHLIVRGSVDRKVYQALEKRQEVVEAILRSYSAGEHED